MKDSWIKAILSLCIGIFLVAILALSMASAHEESWDEICHDLHHHVEDFLEHARTGDLKGMETEVAEVDEHLHEIIEASKKEGNHVAIEAAEKLHTTNDKLLDAVKANDQDKVKTRMKDMDRFMNKIMASKPSWVINEMREHVKEMKEANSKGDKAALIEIAKETYGHMSDIVPVLKKRGKTKAAEIAEESKKHMKLVTKYQDVMANINEFAEHLDEIEPHLK